MSGAPVAPDPALVYCPFCVLRLLRLQSIAVSVAGAVMGRARHDEVQSITMNTMKSRSSR
jgi:hypothetical protein